MGEVVVPQEFWKLLKARGQIHSGVSSDHGFEKIIGVSAGGGQFEGALYAGYNADRLNRLGEEGWELVTVLHEENVYEHDTYVYYLKRAAS